jgi:predicted double-glycine peptidase
VAGPGTSWRELRDRGVVRQQYDYSCGAAAFATLLLHGLADPVTEEELLARVLARTSETEQRLIQNKGLSVLDMQRLAHERGYRAQGYRLAADQLQRLRRPAIAFIRPLGYEHFAVLKGFRGGKAHLADPSQGNWVMPAHRFFDMWLDASGKGVILVVEPADGRWPPHGPLDLDASAPGARPPSARELLDVPRTTPYPGVPCPSP